MAKIICVKYGYREYNSEGEKWGKLSTAEYIADSSIVINKLYEKYGDSLWNSIKTTNNNTMIISVTDTTVKPCIEWKIIIKE